MNNKRTICVVSSSRADYNHLHLLMREINKSPKLNLKIIVTGMHMIKDCGLTYREILKDGFKIDKRIQTYQTKYKEKDILNAMSNILKFAYSAFNKLSPDISHAYHLNYDEVECCTSAEYGYFWRLERNEHAA